MDLAVRYMTVYPLSPIESSSLTTSSWAASMPSCGRMKPWMLLVVIVPSMSEMTRRWFWP